MNIPCHLSGSCLATNSLSARVVTERFVFSMLLPRELIVYPYSYTWLMVICRHLVRTIVGHAEWVRMVIPSTDGRLLASSSSDHVRLSSCITFCLLTFATDCSHMGFSIRRIENGVQRTRQRSGGCRIRTHCCLCINTRTSRNTSKSFKFTAIFISSKNSPFRILIGRSDMAHTL